MCIPIRSYLKSPAAKAILDGKPFAAASISRGHYSINLGEQRKLAEKHGGRFTDKTHFVVAGGQVKSMLSRLGHMKHGEAQERVMGLKMPPPNLQPDFEEQAKTFVTVSWTEFSSQSLRKEPPNEPAGQESPPEHPAGDDRPVAVSTSV